MKSIAAAAVLIVLAASSPALAEGAIAMGDCYRDHDYILWIFL